MLGAVAHRETTEVAASGKGLKHNETKMVDAIIQDNPSEFVNAFKNDMAVRVSQKLDDERTQVAKNIVNDEPKEE